MSAEALANWHTYWFMFPISVAVSTTAMSFGIGGAVFFSPIFILLFPLTGVPTLDPASAFSAALLTELAGFASGLIAYAYKRLIDFKTGGMLILVGVPMAVGSTFLKRRIPQEILILCFSIGMFLLATYGFAMTLYKSKKAKEKKLIAQTNIQNPKNEMNQITEEAPEVLAKNENNDTPTESESQYLLAKKIEESKIPYRRITDWKGNVYEYFVCRPVEGMVMVMMGAFMTGLISVGIGETAVATMNNRCNIPLQVSSATSVMVVAVVILASNVTDIIIAGIRDVPWFLVMWSASGVLVGGQIGSFLSSKVKPELTDRILVILFLVLGLFMGTVVILSYLHITLHKM